jgi:hypothetical protein
MKHPTQQEWVAYLYREVDSTTRSRLEVHLAGCENCRAQLDQWRRAQQHLDSWQPPKPTLKSSALPPFSRLVRWAAAALFMVALGFALGRSSSELSAETVAALRDELRGELTELVNAQFSETSSATLAAAQSHTASAIREFVDLYQSDRAAANQAISTAISRLDTAFLSLRKDLETVALNSDVGLRHTQQQLVRLADYTQADSISPTN